MHNKENMHKGKETRMLMGVNFDGMKIAERQSRPRTTAPPSNYIGDSFRVFSENKLDCIRVPFYWESFEKDPDGFFQELGVISEEADKNNLSCIYDNHQWECSSFLGRGIGFPNSLLSPFFQRNPPTNGSWNHPNRRELERFWNHWWDGSISNGGNRDGWELQRDLLRAVVNKLSNKKSTIGFEILNEPQAFRRSDFKVSEYHDFMIANLEKDTEKPFHICYTYSNSIRSIGLPWRQSKIMPNAQTKNEIIFDVHPNPPCQIVLLYYELVSALMKNSMMYAGEFNSGVKENATINARQHSQYIKRFLGFSMHDAAFWWWAFGPDNAHPAFSLTKVSDNRILPNENFENLCKAIKSNLKEK